MAAALETMMELRLDQVENAIEGLKTERDALDRRIKEHEKEIDDARDKMRAILDTLGAGRKSSNINYLLDEREAEIIHIRHKISKLKRELKPLVEIKPADAADLLLTYQDCLAPLFKDLDDQKVAALIYPWHLRFTVDLEMHMTVTYNWRRMLVDLRKILSTPTLPATRAIRPGEAEAHENRA
ncbi:MAG: hypothetical protein HQL35_14960 [Alphaproteobacteria bacterium]|nr:hypothetical protein [Alphaproteobacteria bacterium]